VQQSSWMSEAASGRRPHEHRHRHGFVLFEQAEFDNYHVRHAGTVRLSCPRG